jgi:hypothetical protein
LDMSTGLSGGSLVQLVYEDIRGLVFSERDVVSFDYEFNGIAQRRVLDYHHFRAFCEAHLHHSEAEVGVAAHLCNFALLAGFQVGELYKTIGTAFLSCKRRAVSTLFLGRDRTHGISSSFTYGLSDTTAESKAIYLS